MRERKLRGKRRYYRKLNRWATNFCIDTSPGHWYDLWHDHPDLEGVGNRSGRARAAHLRALFRAFRNLVQQTRTWDTPHQIFLSVCAANAGQDAIYVHTPNPNETQFPHAFEGFTWSGNWPALLASFARDELEIAETKDEDGVWWAIRQRGV